MKCQVSSRCKNPAEFALIHKNFKGEHYAKNACCRGCAEAVGSKTATPLIKSAGMESRFFKLEPL